jgi:hypothetical protein
MVDWFPGMTDWQDVRAMRANPPGYATSGARRKVFGSALQQAEELATAAEHAGYATKPILLFYALTQAYRAACAARMKTDWEPSGHGLAVPNRGSAVLDAVVKKDGTGLYQAAMAVAGDEEVALDGEVTLREVWASNAELRQNAPDEVLALPGSLKLHLPYPPPTDSSAPEGVLLVLVEGLPEVANKEELITGLAAYPSLAETQPAEYPSGLPVNPFLKEVDRDGVAFRQETSVSEYMPVISAALEKPEHYESRFKEIAPIGIAGRAQERAAPPAIGDPSLVHGPVGMWWLLLIGLSSLARYHPGVWTAALDLDRSPLAVGLQRALDRFQLSLPHHVLESCGAVY